MDLAKEEKTHRELAVIYECSQSSIGEFKSRHLAAIVEARENLASEFVGMWITQKADRLAEYQDLFEGPYSARDRETKAAMLRHVAEELGQIPNKSTLDITAEVKVRIEGLDDV